MTKLDDILAKMLETTASISISKTASGFMARCSIHGKYGNIAPVGYGTTSTEAMMRLTEEAKNLRRIIEKNSEEYKDLRPGQTKVKLTTSEKDTMGKTELSDLDKDLKFLNLPDDFSKLTAIR